MSNDRIYDETQKYERFFVKAYNDLIISKLTNSELRFLLYLKTFGQTGNKIFPSFNKITEDLNFSSATISKAIKGLQEKGYLHVEKENVSSGKRNNYYILDPYYKELRNFKNDKSNVGDKEGRSEENTKKTKIPYKKVVDYLNEKTGKNFSPKAKETKKLISGRYNEGNTLDDFKHVIDVKVADWLDNDSMKTYLKPDTLFNSSNFDKYKNETIDEVKARRKHWENKNNSNKGQFNGYDSADEQMHAMQTDLSYWD